jgi:small subunit ribosomal protein S18
MRTQNNRRTNTTKRTTNTKKAKRVITEYIDYKDAKQLQKFVNDQGKIIPKRVTGLSAKQHRELVRAIKRARQIAIMPFISEAVK